MASRPATREGGLPLQVAGGFVALTTGTRTTQDPSAGTPKMYLRQWDVMTVLNAYGEHHRESGVSALGIALIYAIGCVVSRN